MSIAESATTLQSKSQSQENPSEKTSTPSLLNDRIKSVLEKVSQKIAPVWPLKDYVAVNPYVGLADHEFLSAYQRLSKVADVEFFMPLEYYQRLFQQGLLDKTQIHMAIDELVDDGIPGAECIDVNRLVHVLKDAPAESSSASHNSKRTLHTYVEMIDRNTGSEWLPFVIDEISKHCSNHYDDGQAIWRNPWKGQTLYKAWRSSLRYDRNFELLGIKGFRSFVQNLPAEPQAAVVTLLHRANVPESLWEDFLLCQAMTISGWSAWTRYQSSETGKPQSINDFNALLAMRLAYDLAVSENENFRVDWESIGEKHLAKSGSDDDALARYALLRASEVAHRKNWIGQLTGSKSTTNLQSTQRKLAQLVFCIDVRSERIRRNLESVSPAVETFGFAGFFGVPMEFVPLGEKQGSPQVPVLISPKFCVHETLKSADQNQKEATLKRWSEIKRVKRVWKEFKSAASGCVGHVESTGLLYGMKMLLRSFLVDPVQLRAASNSSLAPSLAPSLDHLEEQEINLDTQIGLAESILRGIGIVEDFASLVVLCGHGSQTQNNPLQAGLDCGACGGHSGEPNARFAAELLNQQNIRAGLAERGIEIPTDTYFVAGLHNTTTDEIQFFDVDQLPETHIKELEELRVIAAAATQSNRLERLPFLTGKNSKDLLRRSRDWSELRPEWGLAGNAAFIAAPRDISREFSLEGRAFLHSYDSRRDPEFAVLEQILTAPLVVANWINMQYYASTVDPTTFGSGSKTIHNVVGKFGCLSGNSGDLTTGLPWQSLHDGNRLIHEPLRLHAIIAAPRVEIEKILAKHNQVTDLVANGWIQLFALEDGSIYRFSGQRVWQQLSNAKSVQPTEACFQ